MKKLLFASCLILGGIASYAQDSTSTDKQNQQQYPAVQDDRERINSTDLPDPVKRSLEGQEYRGWLINGAYKSNSASSDIVNPTDTAQTAIPAQEVYIVELKNGAQTKTVRFGKDGKPLDDPGMKEQD